MSLLFVRHQERLELALKTCLTRGYWSPFQESPSRRYHPEGAHMKGKQLFESFLQRPFPLELPGEVGQVGKEVSPYTQEPLGITYPKIVVEPAMEAGRKAMISW